MNTNNKILNIIYPYYTNKLLLRDQLEKWEQYSEYIKSNIRIIIVDDGSPFASAQEIIETSKYKPNISIHLLKVHEDILWNTAGSRNLGMYYVQQNFGENAVTFLSLMDAFLPEETITYILKNRDNLDFENKIFLFKRHDIFTQEEWPAHFSLLLLKPSIYFSVGGLDEDFSGAYGFDDTLFKHTVDQHTDLKFELLDHYIRQYPPKGEFYWDYEFMENGDHRINKSRNLEIFNKKQLQNLEQLTSSKNLRFNWSILKIIDSNP